MHQSASTGTGVAAMAQRWCLIILAALVVGACSPLRAYESASLLADIAAGEVSPDVERQSVSYRIDGRPGAGDLYRSKTDEPRAGLVVVPGASPQGRDDPRVVAFAAALADADFAVLVPEIENLRRLTISSADTQVIADALKYLEQQQGADRPLGAVAISYAVGPATLAVHQPDLRDRVDVMVAIGGYYDSAAVATFFTTGYFNDPETQTRRYLEPNSYGKWVFVRANAGRLEEPRDQWLLAAMADRKLADPAAPLEDLENRLGPDGKAVADFLNNRDPARAADLIEALPPGVRGEMEALDLSAQELSGPGPLMVLVHGRDDSIVPYSESLALAAAVRRPGEASRARVHLLDGLDHADLESVSLGDTFTLVQAIYDVLLVRDGG
ncbi:alpha/beta hydrolase [Pelagibius litoralis]|uniref:Alpha/beta hydrolase n=1 Tax=Pelagibius litoralis TaxID=374515 RepID=A0A967EYU7_9PROT|nr:alpha/beta hydrolase [Pelagibius litoralis]NIA69860.1 alpha/beta hydrolase [Pelagibius litoralis]